MVSNANELVILLSQATMDGENMENLTEDALEVTPKEVLVVDGEELEIPQPTKPAAPSKALQGLYSEAFYRHDDNYAEQYPDSEYDY